MTLRERIRSFFSRIFRRKELEVAEIPEPIIEEPIVEPRIEPILPEIEPEVIPEEPLEIEEEPIVEEKVLSKIVIFYERIRGTRIKRKVQRTYPVDMSDEEIQRQLSRQYDNGGNFVVLVESISYGEYVPGAETEIERGLPGSADVSP